MATHYKYVYKQNEETGQMVKYITPCSSRDPEGFEKNWMSNADNVPLLEPILKMTEFLKNS